MKTWVHFVFSLALAAVLYPIFNWRALLILLGGVFVDIDHYFWYAYRYKRFNIFECYKYYITIHENRGFEKHSGSLLIFHTVEFLLAVVALSFYSEYALAFAIGFILHCAMDLTFLYFVPKRFIANHSAISWVIKNKIQKV